MTSFIPTLAPSRATHLEEAKKLANRGLINKVLSMYFKKSLSAPPQPLVDGLWHGDPLMDDFVAWMFANNPKVAKKQFEQALNQGIESVEDCPEPLQKLFKSIEPPSWLQPEELDKAVVAMQRMGESANLVLRDLALMGG